MKRRLEIGFREGFVVPIHNPAGPPCFVTMAGAALSLTPATRQLLPLVARSALERIQVVGRPKMHKRPLSPRECEILSWVARGESAGEIGAALNITESTVETHMRHVCLKLRASNRAHAVAIAKAIAISRCNRRRSRPGAFSP
jgi:DNA-binding CsgD family transcriptional regulator